MSGTNAEVAELVASVARAVVADLDTLPVSSEGSSSRPFPISWMAMPTGCSQQVSARTSVRFSTCFRTNNAATTSVPPLPRSSTPGAWRSGTSRRPLSWAYRVGQARFINHCITELISQGDGPDLQGSAALHLVEAVSTYVDHVVEEVLASYTIARDDWVRDRSAVRAMRVREILRAEPQQLPELERHWTIASATAGCTPH